MQFQRHPQLNRFREIKWIIDALLPPAYDYVELSFPSLSHSRSPCTQASPRPGSQLGALNPIGVPNRQLVAFSPQSLSSKGETADRAKASLGSHKNIGRATFVHEWRRTLLRKIRDIKFSSDADPPTHAHVGHSNRSDAAGRQIREV